MVENSCLLIANLFDKLPLSEFIASFNKKFNEIKNQEKYIKKIFKIFFYKGWW